jgi:hypothetical protein
VNTAVSIDTGVPFPVRCLDTAGVATPVAHAGGTATGGEPLWFQSDYQRGSAFYLACSLFADYGAAGDADRLRIEQAFSALLLSVDVEPRARVVDSAGARVGLCQFRARSVCSTELIVLLRDYRGLYDPVAPEVDGELLFGVPAHTYDVEAGVYLGYGDRLQLRIGAYTFRAFARLPYRVEGVDVQVTGSPRLGDSILVTTRVTAATGEPCSHYLRLDVLDADDRPLRHLASEAMADCGIARFTVSSAFNDPPGVWTIVVSDVATGMRGETTVDLGSGAQPAPQPEPFLIDAVDD